MDKLKVFIADPDERFSELAAGCLSRFPDMELLGSERSGRDAYQRICTELPDAVLFDLLLPEMDGISLLRRVMDMKSPPAMICCTRFYSDVALESMRTYGACLMLFKPVDLKSLRPALMDCVRMQRDLLRARRESLEADASVNHQIAHIHNQIVSLGIPAKLVGCGYLTEGVRLALSDASLTRNLSKGLYLEISRSMNTTPARVERCIRNAIAAAYQSGSLDGKLRACPSNKEFINYLLRTLDIPAR